MFPYIEMAGTDISSYKRGGGDPQNTQQTLQKKSRGTPPSFVKLG
jgi:hypothetical protein